jgi:Predicted membrane protein
MSSPQPISESSRVESLDVVRGFALLGILLLNIIGFGLLSPSYSNPGFDLSHSSFADILSWAAVDLFAEEPCGACFRSCLGRAWFYLLRARVAVPPGLTIVERFGC